MFLVKLSFFIGGVLSSVIRNTQRRRRFRGKFNLFVLRPYIVRFMRRAYGVKVESVRFVRQQSMSRVVGIVNNKYFVKIFRNVSVKRVQDFAKLIGVIENTISVNVPHVVADDKLAMYSCKKIDGLHISKFDKDFVIKHKTKLFNQIKKIIKQLQSVDINSVPVDERFVVDMYGTKHINSTDANSKCVFGHFDLNFGSFLFDKDLNIVGVIDWDTISITDDVDGDWKMFMMYWERYVK